MSKRDYIQDNKEWLEAKAKEEGVKALPKGIYYKDAYWRQVGTLYPSRDGLWQILPAWHPWWLDSYF